MDEPIDAVFIEKPVKKNSLLERAIYTCATALVVGWINGAIAEYGFVKNKSEFYSITMQESARINAHNYEKENWPMKTLLLGNYITDQVIIKKNE